MKQQERKEVIKMADSFHFSVNIISRGKGKSAVASAAYISGEKIKNEWDGVTHDYTRKQGVISKEIFLPDHAPEEYKDRKTLWNSVELFEKNSHTSDLAALEMGKHELRTYKHLESLTQVTTTRKVLTVCLRAHATKVLS